MIVNSPTQVILIGNYPPDKQESMERFAQMLLHGFQKNGLRVELWRPLVLVGTLAKTTKSGFGKWLGYIDKWILFPVVLHWRLHFRRSISTTTRFHVCDHSNSPYLGYLPADRSAITCHDVLAIRGAFGYEDAYCPATPAGVILQKWILKNLLESNLMVSTSMLTLNQFKAFPSYTETPDKKRVIIPLTFNADFKPLAKEKRDVLLRNAGVDIDTPFLLHVGSSLPRKNRKMLLDMVSALGQRWNGNIYFAGQEMDSQLKQHAESLGLTNRAFSIVKPNHELLLALYSAAQVFVFPSFSEGFGWPTIEAQACGTPVIASSLDPMPEISGGAALHANPNDPGEFANAFLLLLENEAIRKDLIKKGFENIRRFDEDKVISSYMSIHELVN